MSLRTLVNASLLLAIALALAVLALREGGRHGIEIEIRDPHPGIDEIRVHVSGAVDAAGVVTVAPGSRVLDAVLAAGGFAEDADAHALNLSRRVTDQDEVRVPRVGAAAIALLDVNTATARDLEGLPGIGPVTAAAILRAREERPFTTTDELVERGVVSARVYEQIRDAITVPATAAR